MNLHFPLPKIRTIGDELTLSLAKNSHFSFLPSHFPCLPSRRGHHGGAMSSRYFHCQKIVSPSGFVPPLSNGTSRATSDRKPKTNDQILPSPQYYRKLGSASYIVREVLSVRERERDTEKDGSDVTIVALKLAMNLHFPLPKIRTIGDELTLFLAKNSHFSFLPSYFPSLPSRRGPEVTIVALKFAMPLSIAKIFFALFVPPLSNGTSRATSDRKPKTKFCTVLFCSSIEKLNQINTKNYWK